MNRYPLFLAAAGALALAACSQNAADDSDTATTATATETAVASETPATAAATPADSTAAAFLTDAMKGDNSEIKVGTMVTDKAADQKVKDYARMLVNEHGAHKQQVLALGKTMNVPATEEITPDAQALEKKLAGLSGAAFDKAFLDGMVASHTKNIAKYEAQEKAGGPAELSALVKDTLPKLRKHLADAEALRKSM